MQIPCRRREPVSLLIFLRFKQKSHREGVVIGRSTAQWERLMATGRIAQTVVRLSRSWNSGPQRYPRQAFGEVGGGCRSATLRPGRNQGKVAVVYFFSSMWNWRKLGTVQGTVERVPFTFSHSALQKKMWPGGGDKRAEFEVDPTQLPSDRSPQGIKRKVEVKSMPTGLGRVKTEGREGGEGRRKRRVTIVEGEKRRWFQFLGGWSSPLRG